VTRFDMERPPTSRLRLGRLVLVAVLVARVVALVIGAGTS
jgi:hypothetical protein